MIGSQPPPPPPPPFLDPASNNLPLNFKGNMRSSSEGNESSALANNPPIMNPMMGPAGLMMSWSPMMGPMGDPSMMMWPTTWGPVGAMTVGSATEPFPPQAQREIIKLKSATLYPPPPNSKPPTYRERPSGCRTIFVGGLPENVTEDILREMFENCGNVVSLRLSKKNFAHIRFELHDSVDHALYYSGYRMKIEDKEDKPNTGRIHVDYAQARDDLYEYEFQQRTYERENRHRERMEEDLLRSPSPPRVIQYSDHEALILVDCLKADETFVKGTHTLVTWLDRGDCNRRTANTFYSLLQSTNVHVRRLMNEKSQLTNELEQMKLKFRQSFEALIHQLDQIDKVFSAASKQKAWDHFTKAQRKNIETWRKHLQDLKAKQEAEFLQNSGEAEMEMSDGEDLTDANAGKRKRTKLDTSSTQSVESMMTMASDWIATSQLRDENDILKCQLEAYKNEVSLLKQEAQLASDEKDRQIKQLQMALESKQQQLHSCQQLNKANSEMKQKLPNESPNGKANSVILESEDGISEDADDNSDGSSVLASTSGSSVSIVNITPSLSAVTSVVQSSEGDNSFLINNREARLIALVTTFLHVHPFGANIDYIWSYLHRLNVKIRSSELEDLLEKYPSVFGHDRPGNVGFSAEKKWKFVGYCSDNERTESI